MFNRSEVVQAHQKLTSLKFLTLSERELLYDYIEALEDALVLADSREAFLDGWREYVGVE